MNVRKITIIGNSVALRNRPHLKETSKNYGQLLQEKLNHNNANLVLVENLAFGRATMDDIDLIRDQIINSYADLYIINTGVSDAATREIPYWFGNILNNRQASFKQKVFKGIHQFLFLKNRRMWVNIRGKRAWVSAKKFERKFAKLISDIQHNTSGKIICLPLLPPDERVEHEVPGTAKNYQKFNNIIQRLSHQYEFEFIKLDHLSPKPHFPDGTHFSQEGNQEVAKVLFEMINNKLFQD